MIAGTGSSRIISHSSCDLRTHNGGLTFTCNNMMGPMMCARIEDAQTSLVPVEGCFTVIVEFYAWVLGNQSVLTQSSRIKEDASSIGSY